MREIVTYTVSDATVEMFEEFLNNNGLDYEATPWGLSYTVFEIEANEYEVEAIEEFMVDLMNGLID